MSIHNNIRPVTAADLQAAIDHILSLPRVRKWDARDEFEPVGEDWSDPGFEGADSLEARETRWRNGR